MPFVSNIDEQDQKNPAQGPVVPSGTGVPVAAASGVGGGAPAQAQPGQPGAGGGFATLDKYLTANQGQAEPLANKITAGIDSGQPVCDGQRFNIFIQFQTPQGQSKLMRQNRKLLLVFGL